VAPDALADGILDVLETPGLAARLSANTRPVARALFGMDRNVERYLDVYARALARRRGATTPARSMTVAPAD
jgi:glycosyltransferase involved in cell wall biosynthesis